MDEKSKFIEGPFRRNLVYLASPYSHEDPKVRHKRCNEAARVVLSIVEFAAAHDCPDSKTALVFSPVVYSHPVDIAVPKSPGWEYWMEFCCRMLAACETLMVLITDGWDESKGVREEIRLALSLRMPIWTIKQIDGTLTIDSKPDMEMIKRVAGI